MKQWLSFIILLFCTACAPTQIVFQNSLAENSEDADERKRIEKFEQFLVDGMKWECVYDKHANYSLLYIQWGHFDIPIDQITTDSMFLAHLRTGPPISTGKRHFEDDYAVIYITDSTKQCKLSVEIFAKDNYSWFIGNKLDDVFVNTYYTENMEACFYIYEASLTNFFMIKNNQVFVFRYDYINGKGILYPFTEALTNPEIKRTLW